MSDYDFLVKVLLVGDSGVGKSCLVEKYHSGTFRDSFITTIGVDFKIVHMDLCDRVFKVQIWDTAGQERFRAIAKSYFRGAQGVLLVYDVTDRDTFASLDRWYKDAKRESWSGMKCVVVGNKADHVVDRKVSTEEGRAFAAERDLAYIETSAKTGQGVENLFEALVTQVYRDILELQEVKDKRPPTTIRLAGRTLEAVKERDRCC